MDGNKLLTNVSSRYGAPMGRRTIADNPEAVVRVFRVQLIDSCYDSGGAYWGCGEPLYCAIGDDFQDFTRAANRNDAIDIFAERHPQITFQRGKRS